MLKTTTLNVPVPGDPSGRALGVVLPRQDVDRVLRPGMLTVQQTMPTLAATATDILAEIEAPGNQLGNNAGVLIRIDRSVDEELLLEGRLKVLGCDESKILALVAAFGYEGSARAHELSTTLGTALIKGGVPFRVDGEFRAGASIHLRIFDQSLEIKLVRPS
jgi:hypothetical protein